MTSISSLASHEQAVVEPAPVRWSFLTTHAQVLVAIAEDPEARLRDLADRVSITERATHRIVSELVEAKYISRTRVGRRNTYAIDADLAPPDPMLRDQRVGELLTVLTGGRAPTTGGPDA